MQKQINLVNIELESLNMKSVIESFCHSDEIVFVTEQGRLVGGMTEGDICRKLKKVNMS